MKNILILCIFILLIGGCKNREQSGALMTAEPQGADITEAEAGLELQIFDGHNARNSLDYAGTYALEGGSKTIEITYEGTFSANINGMYYSGNFEWLTGFIIGMEIGGVKHSFFVGENFLRQTEPDGDKQYTFRMRL